jgi:hypothetical protein
MAEEFYQVVVIVRAASATITPASASLLDAQQRDR